ncbi:MAG: hypothetical protein B7X59_10560, partial [Polaromonas sp. 39-63-203]
MGGFKPSAASALTKDLFSEGRLRAREAGEGASKTLDNASVWHAPQYWQETPWATPPVAPSPSSEWSLTADSPQSWPTWTAGIAWWANGVDSAATELPVW